MNQRRGVVSVAIGLSVIAFGIWAFTDRHVYTKFQSVERVEVAVDPDDPLAGTGFYDEESSTSVVRRPGFHLGLLPVPQGLFDKHLLSVTTILALVWIPSIAVLWWRGRPRRPG